MKPLRLFSILLAVLLSVCLSQAQERILVANSSVSGTYELMTQEISDYCSNEQFSIESAPGIKGGIMQNLDALRNNRASAAFVRADVIYALAQSDPTYRNFKTLVALYPEDLHVLTLRQSKMKKLGTFSFGTKDFNTVEDLAGYPVGASSGGHITGRILKNVVGFSDVREYPSGKAVMAALDNGEIAAAIFLGGTPLPSLQGLSGDTYKLLPVSETTVTRLSGIYKRSQITYANLGDTPVSTLSSEALIITRKYTTAKMIEPQARFRSCFYAHLTELQETPGKHPKWQEVSPTNHGSWEWYDLPTVGVPVSSHKR